MIVTCYNVTWLLPLHTLHITICSLFTFPRSWPPPLFSPAVPGLRLSDDWVRAFQPDRQSAKWRLFSHHRLLEFIWFSSVFETFIGFIFTQQLIVSSTDMAAVVRDPMELLISVLLMMVTPWSWPEAVHPSSAPHSRIMTTSYPFMPRSLPSAHSITDNVSSCLNQRNTSLSIKRKRINHLSCGNFKWVNM